MVILADEGWSITIPPLDIVGVAAIIVALGIIFALMKKGNRFFKKANQVMDDWNGTPEEGGHASRPGVIEHFHMIDAELADNRLIHARIEKKVDDAIHELTPNEGGSIKDQINRMELQQQLEIKERKLRQEEYDADKKRNRAEWIQVFGVVREMISLPDEDQVRVWDELTKKYADDTLVDPKDQQL
jgi:hypothetical protein